MRTALPGPGSRASAAERSAASRTGRRTARASVRRLPRVGHRTERTDRSGWTRSPSRRAPTVSALPRRPRTGRLPPKDSHVERGRISTFLRLELSG
ncbi:cAMP-dependent protein kinase inhibitor gamma isoform X1 [Tachyglossus aculeatus]|uniref:cAMP-dependent protein kinase inhibitor gamma isoform X1 n=1 Tax=Tachyglossus aculeatus TaxID=9261 RepID=UPI0018F2F273|nr:cAMP-dependent protein kinase inhibitor gamma isoform X1 [Tachyglossus aculeatus]